ncbi:uncharacterized protein LOC114531348 isoform X3 [Dendronephthya gigantea]|uniref:uncharacterized protein LOC114531348 isoform X3 n=1 Tax=Dendronephthya gigantea TaxID=151771 RepID=UPI0010699913|nr:uncharacterized protein LOC114531348 isoform X3 [Dendronephthya gigantea]
MHELSPKPLVRSWSVPSRMDLIPISYSHDGHLQILEELLKSNDGYSDENMYETYSIASTNTDEHMTWGKVEQHSGQSHRNAKSGHYSLASIFNKFKKYSSEKSINLKPRSPSDKNQEIEQELDEDHYEIIEELKSPGVLKKSLKRSQREEMNKDDPDTPPPVPPRKSTFYVNIKYDDETAPSFQPRKFPPNKAAYVNEIYETKDCSDDNHYDNTCEVPDAEEMSDDVTGDMKNDKIIDKCTHEYSEVFKCDDGEKYETNEEHAVQKMISDNFARSVLSRFYSQEWPEEDFDGDVYEETNTCGNKSREQPHELQEPQGKVEEKLDEKVTSENDSYLEEMRFGNSDSSAGHLTNDAIDDSDIALNIGNKGHVKNVLSLFSKNS